MRYPVVIHPNEHLKMKAQPVTIITDEIVQLLEDMYETMLTMMDWLSSPANWQKFANGSN